ncbi:MAG: T9SS type A sorting domain-containing protein [Candidatus Eisenbacteria bacterium]|nr:T9SS type A sorting domain-containing protein [Candidatus Eisenbacteria bacterium]
MDGKIYKQCARVVVLLIGLLWSGQGLAAPTYTAVIEWNGPYFNAINAAGLDQMVNNPVSDIPFQGSKGIGARYAADGRKMVYVLDGGNDRIQGFEVSATYVIDDSDNFTFQALGVTPAAQEWDTDQIVLAEYGDPAANWVIPYTEVVIIDGTTWGWVANLTGFTAADKVYTIDYDDASAAPEVVLPANSLSSTSSFEIRYLVTDYQGGGTAAFGLGDLDYGNSSGASVALVEFDEATGGPASFQDLASIMVAQNENTATSDDIFVIDEADNSGSQNEEFFVYTVTAAGVESYQQAYDDVLTNPTDVYVAWSGASVIAAQAAVGGGATFWDDAGGAAAITDPNQVTGHTYRATSAGGNVTITDLTTNRVLVSSTAYANLADPLLVVPGISADIPAADPGAADYDWATTVSTINHYAFIADAGANRIKVVEIGNFAWAGDELPGDAKTMTAQPAGAGLVGATADVEYDLTTPGTVPDNWVTWTLTAPIKEGSLDEMTLDPDGTPATWTRIDNLQTAGPGDQVYELDWRTGQITFGDGVHGEKPAAATDIRFTYTVTPDVLRYGTVGSGNGQFSNPHGICARWNSSLGYYDVYVADSGNYRIQKLAFHPPEPALQIPAYIQYVTQWSTASSGSDDLVTPWDLDVEDDGSGDVYVAVVDAGNDRIVIYHDVEAEGGGGATAPSYSTSFGSTGNTLGGFVQAETVDLVDNGAVLDVYVSDGSRDRAVKFEAAPVPTIALTFTGASALPTSFPPSSSYTFTFSTQNAPDGGWVDFYYDTASTFDAGTAELCFTAGTISPSAGTTGWTFSASPSGTPADGTYYLYAILRDGLGGLTAQDQSASTELLTIDSALTTALAVRDQRDGDKALLFQNNMEQSIEMRLIYPDSVVGASYGGTFPADYLQIEGIAPGNAWAGTGYTDLLFNSTYDNISGTYLISASVTGAPTGLNGAGPYVVATVRMKAKSTAVTEQTRIQSGSVALNTNLSQITDINGDAPIVWNRYALDAKVAYLGDIANTTAGTDSTVPVQRPNPDGYINFADQIAFTLGWNGENGIQDPIADIGPASGSAPSLIPAPDNSWDVDDLLSFSTQFSWFASKGYTGSQTLSASWNPAFMPLNDPVEGAAEINARSDMETGIEPIQTVEIVASHVEGLMGAMIRLSYDDSQMEFLGAEDGGLLGRSGGYVMFHTIEGAGRVEIDATRLHPEDPGVDGEGVIARFHFRVLKGNEAPLMMAYDLRDKCNHVIARGEKDLAGTSEPVYLAALYQNVPNPVRPTTSITYALPRQADARLAIYDVRGRQIRLLSEGPHTAGYHTIVWDGRSDMGERAASGVYFYMLNTEEIRISRKLLVTR